MMYELRQYRTFPGKRDEWVEFADERIIPSLVAYGVPVLGSFIAPEEEDLFVWIRGFRDEEHRAEFYANYFKTDEWNELLPRVQELLDWSRAVVIRIVPTSHSAIQ